MAKQYVPLRPPAQEEVEVPTTGTQDIIGSILNTLLQRALSMLGEGSDGPETTTSVRRKYTKALWVGAATAFNRKKTNEAPVYTRFVIYRPFTQEVKRSQATSDKIARWVSDPTISWSPHFTVTETGTYMQHVDLLDEARHTKNSGGAKDADTIGIAIPGRVNDEITEDIYGGLATLLRELAHAYDIPLTLNTFGELVFPDSAVSDYIDPGANFDFEKLARRTSVVPVAAVSTSIFEEYEATDEDAIFTAIESFAEDAVGPGLEAFMDRARRRVHGYIAAGRLTSQGAKDVHDNAADDAQKLARGLARDWTGLSVAMEQGTEGDDIPGMDVSNLPFDIMDVLKNADTDTGSSVRA